MQPRRGGPDRAGDRGGLWLFDRLRDRAGRLPGGPREHQGTAPGGRGHCRGSRAELVRRGVEVSEVHDFGGGVKGAEFADPDGNSFELQEIEWRRGETF